MATENGHKLLAEEQSLLRSAKMSLIQLYIPTEAAQAVVGDLGELGIIQFKDLNPEVNAFQRTFTGEIRKLDEMERKVRALLDHAACEGVQVRSWLSLRGGADNGIVLRVSSQELDELEATLNETESRILQLDANQQDLMKRFMSTEEQYEVITALDQFLLRPSLNGFATAGSSGDESESSADARLDEAENDTDSMELGMANVPSAAVQVAFVAGSIAKRRMAAFERIVWRVLRGNVYIRSADLQNDTRGLTEEGSTEPRSAFVVFVHGRETLGRVRKISEALGCIIYEVDPEAPRREEELQELRVKLDDVYAVLFNTRQAKRAALHSISDSLERWLVLIRKQKAIYDVMNGFSCERDLATRRYFLAEGWCPTNSLVTIDAAIKTASDRTGLNVAPVLTVLDSSHAQPPTYFPTNKVTAGFQAMTDAYGIAQYGEANPSLFMIITFPFLFAVMFGDVGHALIVASFAAYMVLAERQLSTGKMGEVFGLFFSGRYIILIMSLFSMFTGLIYNDIFSLTLSLFPSSYQVTPTVTGSETRYAITRPSPHYTYPIGIDSIWAVAENKMLFINSYKMKQAILLGVVQMSFGICISATNHLYTGSWLDFWCIFLPQLLFMLSVFGYLGVMIIYKWIAGWDVSILNMFIAMVLRFGALDNEPVYAGQRIVQGLLMVVALICIPWMLAAKPLYVYLERRKYGQANPVPYQATLEANDSNGTDSVNSTVRKAAANDEENDLNELVIHQLVHTIEFVLGSISNTASYLRLWALSLAHSELAHVLWDMTIAKSTKIFLGPALLFPAWFMGTLGILVAMEGMSAFLHALRLHWVEFNNKFFVSGGTKFTPFCLRDELILAEPE